MKIVLYKDRNLNNTRIKNVFNSIRSYFSSSERLGIDFDYVEEWDTPIKCDVAIIWGILKKTSKKTYYRQAIIDFQHKNNKRVICIERGFIDRENYYSVGLNSIVGWGNYTPLNKDNHSRRIKIGLKYPNNISNPKGHILVCGQVFWDSQVQHLSPANIKIGFGYGQWLIDLMRQLIKYNNKRISKNKPPLEIRYREHPDITGSSDKILNKYAPQWSSWKKSYNKFFTETNNSFVEDLSGCHGVIAFNSNSLCEAMILGYPILAYDKGSVVYDEANHDLIKFLNQPYFPDKDKWNELFNKICFYQWNLDELNDGKPFKRFL